MTQTKTEQQISSSSLKKTQDPERQENINCSSSNLNQHITMIYMTEDQNDELVHQYIDQNVKQKCKNAKPPWKQWKWKWKWTQNNHEMNANLSQERSMKSDNHQLRECSKARAKCEQWKSPMKSQ